MVLDRFRVRDVLEHDVAVEQRRMAGQLTPGLDVGERAVLVAADREKDVLRRAQPVAHGGEPGRRRRSHGHEVGEQAHHALDARDLGGAAGYHGAVQDVALPDIARDEQGPRGVDEGVERDALLAADRGKPCAGGPIEPAMLLGERGAIGAIGACRGAERGDHRRRG